jgi:hypothetical protein
MLKGETIPMAFLEESAAWQGSLVLPAWVVALLGASVALVGVLYFALRVRRARRKLPLIHSTVRRG